LAGEIVDQLLVARRLSGRNITHVVFMGMGEPLINLKQVLKATRILHSEIGIPMRHITISTVGLVAEMRELANEKEAFTLAVSLHAPNDALRQTLIPVARKYLLRDLLGACDYYFDRTSRRVTFEYVLIRDVNDRPEHARELAALLQGRHGHVNLIPYNPGAADEYRAPGRDVVAQFRGILDAAGIAVTQRMEKGQEIMAACGQLRKQTLSLPDSTVDIEPPVAVRQDLSQRRQALPVIQL
jgi:23S rRNA (adenine2503-C2)-methyltransferase